ncbi:MAG: sporulation and cell division protein SsgA [Pseudonocardiales bacterium]|nr:sporulation and cell division protein SsgA [Jatrophihabitantaceae bacterium]MCW2605282.1 sporulation and cell division protein SsgA [Pseudonocardiales bacterium]
MGSGADVDLTVRLTLLATEPVSSERTQLVSSLRYSPSDPYAVSVVFPAGPAASAVTWTFDRELMRLGITRQTGLGDVQIWPAPDADDAGTTYVELTAPGGRALLSAPTTALVAFLDATAAAVPFGTEAEFIDMDAELEALLGRTG